MKALRRQVLDVQPAALRAPVQAAIAAIRRGEKLPKEEWMALNPVEQGRASMHAPEFNSMVKRRARTKMQMIDSWPADVRAVANDLGWEVAYAFHHDAKIKSGALIRRLVNVARGLNPNGSGPGCYGNKRVGKP